MLLNIQWVGQQRIIWSKVLMVLKLKNPLLREYEQIPTANSVFIYLFFNQKILVATKQITKEWKGKEEYMYYLPNPGKAVSESYTLPHLLSQWLTVVASGINVCWTNTWMKEWNVGATCYRIGLFIKPLPEPPTTCQRQGHLKCVSPKLIYCDVMLFEVS